MLEIPKPTPLARWSTCAYCGKRFPYKEGKLYCRRSHKKHASELRRKAKAEGRELCPTPRKKKYATEDAAAKFNMYGNRPYHCDCDWWHTSSKRK